jgi:hypothetical protein
MKYPFEAPFAEVEAEPDLFISSVFSCLESEFLAMPKGEGFVDYPVFESGYESLKRATNGFKDIDSWSVTKAAFQNPMIIIVLRTMLGFTPPEWAYVTTQRTGVEVSQGYVLTLDRNIRMLPMLELSNSRITRERVGALADAACQLLNLPVPEVGPDKIHRLDKADTSTGSSGIVSLSNIGVPYAMLLYERFLGRPFAGHRDSVSELVGDSLESAIEDVLTKAGISYRKTKRAERIAGFDQKPDFIIPSEFNPQVVIEAKITVDDGTARDKVTRVQHLAEISKMNISKILPGFEVIACIGGRGFGVRRD